MMYEKGYVTRQDYGKELGNSFVNDKIILLMQYVVIHLIVF